MCLTATAVVGRLLEPVYLQGERHEVCSVVDGVAMILSLAAEGWRECYFELLPRGIKLCFRAHELCKCFGQMMMSSFFTVLLHYVSTLFVRPVIIVETLKLHLQVNSFDTNGAAEWLDHHDRW